jgi:N6-L-threonylcarbamoyladenine synthase
MIVLGIETSCDETACALVDDKLHVVSNVVYSQLDHSKYGGIVPEVASRQQIKKIIPIYKACLSDAGMSLDDIDAIAVTQGPGLIGSLLVGVNFAKGLSFTTRIPLIGINHIEGHICSNFLEHPELEPPFISLVISGGHTLLVLVEDYGSYRVIGMTRDDAAGEAYDKVAKLLGLGYPGGAVIDDVAGAGDPHFHEFPRAKVRGDPYAFSFSGLKTAVVLYIRDKSDKFVRENISHICASFQSALQDILLERCLLAIEDCEVDKIAVAGGVAANRRLRTVLSRLADSRGFEVFFPSPVFCTDNGAMIAVAGLQRLRRGQKSDLSLDAAARLSLESPAH